VGRKLCLHQPCPWPGTRAQCHQHPVPVPTLGQCRYLSGPCRCPARPLTVATGFSPSGSPRPHCLEERRAPVRAGRGWGQGQATVGQGTLQGGYRDAWPHTEHRVASPRARDGAEHTHSPPKRVTAPPNASPPIPGAAAAPVPRPWCDQGARTHARLGRAALPSPLNSLLQ